MAAIATLLCPFKPISISKQKQIHLSAAPKVRVFETKNTKISRTVLCSIFQDQKCVATILGAAGLAALITFVEPTFAAELPGSSLQFNEPSNALSLPTWAIHVSSVAEWYD